MQHFQLRAKLAVSEHNSMPCLRSSVKSFVKSHCAEQCKGNKNMKQTKIRISLHKGTIEQTPDGA